MLVVSRKRKRRRRRKGKRRRKRRGGKERGEGGGGGKERGEGGGKERGEERGGKERGEERGGEERGQNFYAANDPNCSTVTACENTACENAACENTSIFENIQWDQVLELAPLKQAATSLWCSQCVWVGEIQKQIKEQLQNFLSIIFFKSFNEAELSLQNLKKITEITIFISATDVDKALKALQKMPILANFRMYCFDHTSSINLILPHEFTVVKSVKEVINIFSKQIDKNKGYSKAAENFSHLSGDQNSSAYFAKLNLSWMLNCRQQGRPQAFKDFVAFTKTYFDYFGGNKQINLSDLQQFEKQYPIEINSEEAREELMENCLKWYTNETFFYKLINMGMRNFTTPVHLAYFRLPITDIYRIIRSLHRKQKLKPFKCYRGCFLDERQVHLLQKLKGNYIQLHGFISTSRDINKAREFGTTMMIISVPSYSENNIDSFVGGFANIQEFSSRPNEEQILFNPHNFFKVLDVRQELLFKGSASPQQMLKVTLEFVYPSKIIQMQEFDMREGEKSLLKHINSIKNLDQKTSQKDALKLFCDGKEEQKFAINNFIRIVQKGLQQQLKSLQNEKSSMIQAETVSLILKLYVMISEQNSDSFGFNNIEKQRKSSIMSLRAYFYQHSDVLIDLLESIHRFALIVNFKQQCLQLLFAISYDTIKKESKNYVFFTNQLIRFCSAFEKYEKVDFYKEKLKETSQISESLTQQIQILYHNAQNIGFNQLERQFSKLESNIIKYKSDVSYNQYDNKMYQFLGMYLQEQVGANFQAFEMMEKRWRVHAAPEKELKHSMVLKRAIVLQKLLQISIRERRQKSFEYYLERYLQIFEHFKSFMTVHFLKINRMGVHTIVNIIAVVLIDWTKTPSTKKWLKFQAKILNYFATMAAILYQYDAYFKALETMTVFFAKYKKPLLHLYLLIVQGLERRGLSHSQLFYEYVKCITEDPRESLGSQQIIELLQSQQKNIKTQLQLLHLYFHKKQSEKAAAVWIGIIENCLSHNALPQYFEASFNELVKLDLAQSTKKKVLFAANLYLDKNRNKFDIFKDDHAKFILRFSELSQEIGDYSLSSNLLEEAMKIVRNQYFSKLNTNFLKYYLEIYTGKMNLPCASPADALANSIAYISLTSKIGLKMQKQKQKAQQIVVSVFHQIIGSQKRTDLSLFDRLDLMQTRKLKVLSQALNNKKCYDDATVVSLLSLFHCTEESNYGDINACSEILVKIIAIKQINKAVVENCFKEFSRAFKVPKITEQFIESIYKSVILNQLNEVKALQLVKKVKRTEQNKCEGKKLQLLKTLQVMDPRDEKLAKNVTQICEFNQLFDRKLLSNFPKCCFHIAKKQALNEKYESAFKYLALYLESLSTISSCVDELLFQLFQSCYFHSTEGQFIKLHEVWVRESESMNLKNANHQRLKVLQLSLFDRIKNGRLKPKPVLMTYSEVRKYGKISGNYFSQHLEAMMQSTPINLQNMIQI